MGQIKTEKESLAANVFTLFTTAIGLCVFAYSAANVLIQPVRLEWTVLVLVIALAVSRIDTRPATTPGLFRWSDLLALASYLHFGLFHAVVLAGIDAGSYSYYAKSSRKLVGFAASAASLAMFIAGAIATLAFGQASAPEMSGDLPAFALECMVLVLATVLVVASYYALKAAIMVVSAALKEEKGLAALAGEAFFWQGSLLRTITGYALEAALCVGIKAAFDLSFNTAIIVALLLVTVYVTHKVYSDKVQASNQYAERMADLHLRTIEALAIAVDAKDEVTHDHVFRVQIYATGLAKLFGLSDLEIEALRAGAILHDIGKLAVPDYILNKPGKLTPAEFDEMKLHTIVGAEILGRVGFPYPVVPVVRHHHERWDGRGYPDGLKGEEIPITARIISVVDCFDAVREDRQYRKAMTRDEAITLIQSNSGTMYDPQVVAAFIEHLPEFEAQIAEHKAHAQPFEKREKSVFFKPKLQSADQEVFERIRNAHHQVDTLYNIAQAIGTSLDLNDALTVFASRLQDIVSYTTCVLYLLRQDTTEIEAVHVSGRGPELFKGARMDAGAGISGWVVTNGHPMHNCDPRLDFDALKVKPPEQYRTATVAPLLKNGRVLGALALYSAERSSYEVDHLRLLEAVAKLVSDVIETPQQRAKDEDELKDAVTNLPNACALRNRFEIEADRARLHKEGFALLVVDLNGLRKVNETLGRKEGDLLLWRVGKVLSTLFRSSDFLCRYADSKFVALLHIDPEEVPELAQRIQRTMQAQDLGISGSNIAISLTIGCACFGIDGDTLDELLLHAIRPIYEDKAGQRGAKVGSPYIKAYDLNQYKVM